MARIRAGTALALGVSMTDDREVTPRVGTAPESADAVGHP